MTFDYLKTGIAGKRYLGLKMKRHTSLGVHFLPTRPHRFWGFQEEWYDGPHYTFGLGGLALFVMTP